MSKVTRCPAARRRPVPRAPSCGGSSRGRRRSAPPRGAFEVQHVQRVLLGEHRQGAAELRLAGGEERANEVLLDVQVLVEELGQRLLVDVVAPASRNSRAGHGRRQHVLGAPVPFPVDEQRPRGQRRQRGVSPRPRRPSRSRRSGRRHGEWAGRPQRAASRSLKRISGILWTSLGGGCSLGKAVQPLGQPVVDGPEVGAMAPGLNDTSLGMRAGNLWTFPLLEKTPAAGRASRNWEVDERIAVASSGLVHCRTWEWPSPRPGARPERRAPGHSAAPRHRAFTATPASILAGGTTLLSWSVTVKPTSLSIDQGWARSPGPASRSPSPPRRPTR